MNAEMKSMIEAHLKVEAELIRLGAAVRDSGGSADSVAAYDEAVTAEVESYETMNAKGLTREGWTYFDKARAALYRGA